MVDQPEYGANTGYLVDSINITFNVKLLNFDDIKGLFLDKGLSAAQLAKKYGVSKTVILEGLHKIGVKVGGGGERMTNPQNYRCKNPPYGFLVKDGKLVPNKREMKVCRLIVELIDRRGFSSTATARELEAKGFKTRGGSDNWDHSAVRRIFERWQGKL